MEAPPASQDGGRMKQVPFGKTGVQVSEMCLGTMMFGQRCDEREADRIFSKALDCGVNFVDTAAKYCGGETESILGRILKGRRDKVFLGTKVHSGLDYESIATCIDGSLERLQTDHVDLYMIHWPKPGMRPLEIMRALNDVVKSGKARFVGCCNYPAWLLCHSNAVAAANGWAQFVCNQVPYNPIERGVEVEVLPQARAEGLAVTIYRALLMGLLAGKYKPGKPIPGDSRATSDDRIVGWMERFSNGMNAIFEMARKRNVSPGHIAIAWLRACPAVTCPIIGSSHIEQLEDNIRAFDCNLDPEEWKKISDAFGAEVKEESGNAFMELRRHLALIAAD
jgi:aryl-alcohol dehydrogenase-like predicted oxidoreductase